MRSLIPPFNRSSGLVPCNCHRCALGNYGHGDYNGDRHDATDSQVRPVTFKEAIKESVDALIDLAGEPRNLAFRNARHARRLDQLVHRTRRDA